MGAQDAMGLNVLIDEALTQFVQSKVASGEYGSPRDVVADALRLLEASSATDKDRSAEFRTAWDEGIASGTAGELDVQDLLREARRCRAET